MSYLHGRNARNLPNGPTYLAELDIIYRRRAASTGMPWPGIRAVCDLVGRPDLRPLRVALCRHDPLLFALLFCGHMLMNKVGQVTFADFHLALCREARGWAEPLLAERGPRKVYVAPRGCGKSQWLMRILPLWAAAYGHSSKGRMPCQHCGGTGRTSDLDGTTTSVCPVCTGSRMIKSGPFILLLSATQDAVAGHVGDLVDEIKSNPWLRVHFPDLYRRKKVNRVHYASINGTMIVATSMEVRLRGLNIQNRRPDLIVCDDIDVDKSSETQIKFITDQLSRKIELLEESARIVIAGTTTVYRGVIHQLLMRRFEGLKNVPADVLEWTARWETEYFEPIITDENYEEHSCWPGKWSVEHLRRVQREQPLVWELEWLNRPVPQRGAWWLRGDYVRLSPADNNGTDMLGYLWPEQDGSFTPFEVDEVGIFLDPASVDKKSSDASAFCIAAYDYKHHRVAILHTEEHVGLVGPMLDARGLELAEAWEGSYFSPQFGVFDGTNGGDNLRAALVRWGMALKLIMIHYKTTAKLANALERTFRGKGQRIIRSSSFYRRGQVAHLGTQAVEGQQTAWTVDESIPLDDMLDVTALAVLWWLDPDWVRPPAAGRGRWS